MKLRRVLIGAMYANLLAVSATAETAVIHPAMAAEPRISVSQCAKRPLIIDLGPMQTAQKAGSDHVVVIYPPTEAGWASRRLLSHFDVQGAPPYRPGCSY